MKYAKVPDDEVLDMYKSLVRPVLDFATPAYHSLLTETQTAAIERLQMHATKIIYGWCVSYATVLEKKKEALEKLSDRRQRLVDQFAKKCLDHPRFSREWFQEKKCLRPGLRKNEKFAHERPRTERFKKNPVTHMKKRLETM